MPTTQGFPSGFGPVAETLPPTLSRYPSGRVSATFWVAYPLARAPTSRLASGSVSRTVRFSGSISISPNPVWAAAASSSARSGTFALSG